MKQNSIDDYDIMKFVKILTVVLIFLVGIYFATVGLVEKKKAENKNDDNKTTYNEVLVSKLLDQSEEEYYVILYTKEDNDYKAYNNLQTSYLNAEDKTKLYYADLSNSFNDDFVNEKSNPKAKTTDKFAFVSGTLLKIVNNKVDSYIEGYTAIINELN